MVVEIKLGYAGAASLLAMSTGAIINEVYTNAWSVTLMLDDDYTPNRVFQRQCERQDLIYEEGHDW